MLLQNSLYLDTENEQNVSDLIIIDVQSISRLVNNVRVLPNSVPAYFGDMSCGVTGEPALPSALRLMAIIIQNRA